VIGRLAGTNLRGEDLWQTAQKLLAQENPGNFNQALMELGATICLPRRPRCTVCPVFHVCRTRSVLPMHKPFSRQKKQAVHYALHCQNDLTFLVKRPGDISFMPEMWELPQIESAAGAAPWLTLRHSITATDFRITVSKIQVRPTAGGRWVSRRQLARMPLTGLARKILRAANVI
jgi:A/G-specific adenine glycosylase